MSLIRSMMVFGTALVLCFSAQAAVKDTQAIGTAATTNQSNVSQKINLNTATVQQLDQLKGVGANKAQAIVDYRSQNGPFKTLNDLTNVNGFSSKTVATLLAKNPGIIVIE